MEKLFHFLSKSEHENGKQKHKVDANMTLAQSPLIFISLSFSRSPSTSQSSTSRQQYCRKSFAVFPCFIRICQERINSNYLVSTCSRRMHIIGTHPRTQTEILIKDKAGVRTLVSCSAQLLSISMLQDSTGHRNMGHLFIISRF